MTTLQEYLNNLENKDQITEINLEKINQDRTNQGITKLLEGGELDLAQFPNCEKVAIEPKLLKTPLVKINVQGLTNLQELIWKETKEDSEEEKKLWTELGIADLTTENNQKRKVVKEINKLVGLWNDETSESLQPTKVHFATQKAPKDQLKDGIMSYTEIKDDEYNIFLQLEQKDKAGNFCPNLVFWTLAREFSVVGNGEVGKIPSSWTHFNQQLAFVKNNLLEEHQKDFELLLKPSTFPTDQLEIKELLSVYYPNSEEITDKEESKATIDKEIIDKTWLTIQKEILELTNQELSKNLDEENLKKLAIKAFIDNQNGYEIIIQYHQQNPFKEKIEELLKTTPLQSEVERSKQLIEDLKKEKEQLPTSENFAKILKEKQYLEDRLHDFTDEETYKEIKEGISKIN